METTAVRLYGKNDLRLESFDLPLIKEDEILVKIISDSICMSSYKAAIQGTDHKRVPKDIEINPIIMGHEFCGKIIEVGDKWKDRFQAGDNFTIQPAHNKNGTLNAPGYSYEFCGGNATYAIIPPEIMEMDCLMKFDSDVFFMGSLAEPMSCIIRAFHAVYHTKAGSYELEMGIKENGNMAILAGAGPMGLGALDYALHNPDRKPKLIVVTDVSKERLSRAKTLFDPSEAKKDNIELIFLNTKCIDAVPELMRLSGGTGYNDVFVFAPIKSVIEQGDAILCRDGCLNFFSGPSDTGLKAEVNFYDIHYAYTHIMGSTSGNNDDMREALGLMAKGMLNPACMVTHIGGLNCAAETTLNLPNILGGKKLIYTGIDMELTEFSDFEEKGKSQPLFAKLAEITRRNNGLWSAEAEKFLLSNKYKV